MIRRKAAAEPAGADLTSLRRGILLLAGRLGQQSDDLSDVFAGEFPEIGVLSDDAHKDFALLIKEASRIAQIQRRLNLALGTMRDGFAVFDSNLRYVHGNRAFCRFFDPKTQLVPGVSFYSLLDGAIASRLMVLDECEVAEWRKAMLSHLSSTAELPPVRIAMPNGRTFNWMSRWGSNGDLVCTATDITQSLQRERQLEEALRKASATDRTRSSFLAAITHELRTPLNGVVGMAEALCDGELNPEQRLYVETIRNSGEALLEIINSVLEQARANAAPISAEARPFDLEFLACEVVNLLSSVAENNGLDLSLQYDPFLPSGFIGDSGRLRQILLNLVGNAIKFTRTGEVVLRITGRSEASRYRLQLTIEDTGRGIDEDKLDEIFEEFRQIGGQSGAGSPGTGLGLAITDQIVRALAGKLWVKSVKEVGTTFGVSVDLELDARRNMRAKIEYDASIRRNRGRIVAIDDTRPSSRAHLARTVRAMGFKVVPPSTSAAIAHPHGAPALLILAGGCAMATGAEPPAGCPVLRLQRNGSAEPLPPVEPGVQTTIARLHNVFARSTLASAIDHAFGMTPPSESANVDPARACPSVSSSPLCDNDDAGIQPCPHALTEEVTGRRMRVLLADDNATNRLVFETMVKHADIELFTASDGFEAVKLWRDNKPDLIFMDISMPGRDGRECARLIRQAETDAGLTRIPIVALTAYDDDEAVSEIRSSGIDFVMGKPMRRGQLLSVIASSAPVSVRPPIPPGS